MTVVKDEKTDELTPIMATSIRMHTAGSSTINGAIERDEHDLSRSYIDRKFWSSHALSLVSIALLVCVTVICIILVVRLRSVEADSKKAIQKSQEDIQQMSEMVRGPLQKLLTANPFLAPQMAQTASFNPPPGVSPVQSESFGPSTRRAPQSYAWRSCENLGKCSRPDFSNPPLVILSLDGFAHYYLERGIVKSLDFMAQCGARAEKVFPSYPTKTFPNHFTMATGLYPESHGVTDNKVFDPTISPDLQDMKRSKFGELYKGEPIWSVYKRVTGKNAACYFWAGCSNNIKYPPVPNLPYNSDMPFKNRLDTIISWLKQPESTRPGLITAYLHQPDMAGHYQLDDSDVNEELVNIDKKIDYFMERLYEENLLECVNVAIVSDHGMKTLNKTYYFDDYVDMSGLVGTNGVVGRIYVNDSRSTEDVASKLRCNVNLPNVKANTRSDISPRKHYSKSPVVGDVILEGPLGTTFYPTRKDDYQLNGDHGYDYINSDMQTIFFIRGPSIKPNSVVAPYQNVEYMNLWMDLLGVPVHEAPNNGTLGTFDGILKNPPKRQQSLANIGKCAPATINKSCGTCNNAQIQSISSKLATCPYSLSSLPISSSDLCSTNLCDSSLVVGATSGDSRSMIVEYLSSGAVSTSKSSPSCEFTDTNPPKTCTAPNGFERRSIAFNNANDLLSNSRLLINVPSNFASQALDNLNDFTLSHLKSFGSVYSISGVAVDVNHDGVIDSDLQVSPSHIYRILITCTSKFSSSNPPKCQNPQDMRILSFLFPIFDKSPANCMSKNEILLDYSSTVRDIERIAGFQFNIPDYSAAQNLILRNNVTTEIW